MQKTLIEALEEVYRQDIDCYYDMLDWFIKIEASLMFADSSEYWTETIRELKILIKKEVTEYEQKFSRKYSPNKKYLSGNDRGNQMPRHRAEDKDKFDPFA